MSELTKNAETIRVLVPVGRDPVDVTHERAAPRRSVESALVIGLLDNHKHNTGKVLDRIEQRFRERYGAVRFVRARKPEAGKSAPGEIIERLAAGCQAVINGIGD